MNSAHLERNQSVYEDEDYLKGEKEIFVWGADKFALLIEEIKGIPNKRLLISALSLVWAVPNT